MRINIKNPNPPPSKEIRKELDEFQAELRITFPTDYLDFMSKHDGGHDDDGTRFLYISSVRGIYIYGAEAKNPKFLVFANNGGGESFCFRCDQKPNDIYMLPSVGVHADAIFVGSDLSDLVNFDIDKALSK